MNFIYEPHRIYVNNEEGKMIVNATFPWLKPGVVVVDHTFVDPSLRGQGIASQLMFEVVNYSKKQGYKVTATCPYAVTWFKKHPEVSNILDELEQAKLAPECQI